MVIEYKEVDAHLKTMDRSTFYPSFEMQGTLHDVIWRHSAILTVSDASKDTNTRSIKWTVHNQ